MAGSGQIYTFSDSTTTRRSVANIVKILDPKDTPLLAKFGTNNQTKFRMVNFPNHKYEWMEDTLRVRTATLGEAVDTTETAIDVASGHGVRFKVGDVWRSDETGELILVTAVTAGSDTVTTVVRNWAAAMGGSQGTATSSITTATNLTYLFNAREEGADSVSAPWTTPTMPYNYSQIFHYEIKVSGSEQDAVTRFGVTDTFKYQMAKALGGAGGGDGQKGRAGDLLFDLENTWFYGQRVQRASGTPGAMGGFKTFVTTNVTNLSATDLTQDNLEDAIQSAWSYGGMPDLIICGAYNKRLISSWYRDSIRTERSERLGGMRIDRIETDFNEVDILLSRRIPADEVHIVQSDLVGWVTLRDWFVEPLGKEGDWTKSQIVGEFGLVIQQEKAHALIDGTATS